MRKREALKLPGQSVAMLRRERGMAQEELAEAPGVSGDHIADVELGARNTGVWSALLLARALSCSPGDSFRDFSPRVLRALS